MFVTNSIIKFGNGNSGKKKQKKKAAAGHSTVEKSQQEKASEKAGSIDVNQLVGRSGQIIYLICQDDVEMRV